MFKSKIFNSKHLFLYLSIFIFMLLLLSGPAPLTFAKDELNVKRDNEKTVYTIEPKEDQKRNQDKDKENAWEMLKNIKPWIQTK